ncbi:outer membrane beta-barrel protein [Pelagicoccus sp. SDUM812005]|uniref:outer membrane beta-barrel protein n=1 Tax=Pelagicoccus sp. SDUM812005 TaxID=3041257 RepID=UPI00280E9499|nr:outer membrane beta-barrel protein [Pelagicoccus sp. SDUM812005]MDQ8183831.1 outer membrane beta-barrel protein [Pelagicoccus sp. SDUM812005]
MKRPTLIIIITLIAGLLSDATAEEKIQGAVSLLYMSGSGSPDAPYSGVSESKDYDGIVPRLTISYNVTDRFEINANYTNLGTLKTSWVGNQTPPLLGVAGRQAITPFEIEEKMEALGLGIAYKTEAGGGSLKFGIEANQINNEHEGWLIKKERDWSLAVSAGYEYLLSDRLSVSADYLHISPPGKSLHLLGGSLRWKF